MCCEFSYLVLPFSPLLRYGSISVIWSCRDGYGSRLKPQEHGGTSIQETEVRLGGVRGGTIFLH